MNKYLKKNIYYIFLIVIIASCSPVKKSIRVPLKEYGSEYIFTNLKNSEIKFKHLSFNFSANYIENKDKISFNGQCRIVKDSAIWISVSPALGIEMLRILITPDSVKMINRIEKTYYDADFQYINVLINNAVDFDMLQSLIVGNDLSYYENDKFKAGIENHFYKLNTIGRQKLKKFIRHENEALIVLIQNIWLDPENFKIKRISLKETQYENKKMDANYQEFAKNGEQFFPVKVSYHIEAEKKIDIEMHNSKIKIDEPFSIYFRIPENYQRIQ
ncbi:MAG: DUF4292 domain-containing protein [Lentimicrobiaceae bacterium]|nr:DUF4292 domain-containing protein [Lentimicrobiaceae bacterium]